MKFLSIAAAALALAFPAFVEGTVTATYNTIYDSATLPLTDVSCSDGQNGLITKGFHYLSDIPTFPHVGGALNATWNSPECGGCWQLTYNNRTVTYTVVDAAGVGFDVSKETMYFLAGDAGINAGRIELTAVKVAESVCEIY